MDHLRARGWLITKQAQKEVGGAINHDHDRPSELDKDAERPGSPQGGFVGGLQCQRFRNQLSKDDVHERDQAKGQPASDRVRGGYSPSLVQPRKQGSQQTGGCRLADPT